MEIQTPRGVFDILPEEQKYWRFLLNIIENTLSSFGFQKIDLPLFEYNFIFEKGIGEGTDVVQKEMFYLSRKDEEEKELVLRPESTAQIARAYIEHGMHTWPSPVKLYYFGPMFRYDRPQKGRFRQFYQFGYEILGAPDSFTDAFLIGLTWEIYKKLNLSNLIIEINSLGCKNCRTKMEKMIVEYFKREKFLLCPDCQIRLSKNPLRILDCKNEKCQPLLESAPALLDCLCDSCREHFKNTLEYLDDLAIPYDLNPKLVRGLDYYTKTTFEIVKKGEKARMSALGGGGRYDDLVELLGGRPTPAIGFAGGIERIIEKIKEEKVEVPKLLGPEIFLVQLGELARRKSLPLLFNLWKAGFKITLALNKESLKSQLKEADKTKVKFALIYGQREALDKTIIVRNMVEGIQETIELEKLGDYLKKKMEEK